MNGMIKLFLNISVNFCESPHYRMSCSHFRERLREFYITEAVIYSTLNESLVTHKKKDRKFMHYAKLIVE